jgi:hypothetical protein
VFSSSRRVLHPSPVDQPREPEAATSILVGVEAAAPRLGAPVANATVAQRPEWVVVAQRGEPVPAVEEAVNRRKCPANQVARVETSTTDVPMAAAATTGLLPAEEPEVGLEGCRRHPCRFHDPPQDDGRSLPSLNGYSGDVGMLNAVRVPAQPRIDLTNTTASRNCSGCIGDEAPDTRGQIPFARSMARRPRASGV